MDIGSEYQVQAFGFTMTAPIPAAIGMDSEERECMIETLTREIEHIKQLEATTSSKPQLVAYSLITGKLHETIAKVRSMAVWQGLSNKTTHGDPAPSTNSSKS